VEFSIANILVLLAFALLVTVTGGVAYLTALEWRDRRRLDEAKRKKNSYLLLTNCCFYDIKQGDTIGSLCFLI
jgi:hypothetical protein